MCGFVVWFIIFVSKFCLGQRLNEQQVLHSHNSYHLAPSPGVNQLVKWAATRASRRGALDSDAWQYSFPTIPQQLEQGQLRSFEFDVYYDPLGGRYGTPAGPKLVGMLSLGSYEGSQPVPSELASPGWKVLHVPDFDYQSSCLSLEQCLWQLKTWSDQNEQHEPLFIRIEPKYFDPNEELGFLAVFMIETQMRASRLPGPRAITRGVRIGREELFNLEATIKSIFGNRADGQPVIMTPQELITMMGPADGTLKGAIRQGPQGWPLTRQVQGRVFFLLVGYSQLYLSMYPNTMEGALFFLEVRPADLQHAGVDAQAVFLYVEGQPLIQNEDIWDQQAEALGQEVSQWVAEGFMVRASGDAGTIEARVNYTGRCMAVMSAGAHFVHTDFPYPLVPDLFPSTYSCGPLPPREDQGAMSPPLQPDDDVEEEQEEEEEEEEVPTGDQPGGTVPPSSDSDVTAPSPQPADDGNPEDSEDSPADTPAEGEQGGSIASSPELSTTIPLPYEPNRDDLGTGQPHDEPGGVWLCIHYNAPWLLPAGSWVKVRRSLEDEVECSSGDGIYCTTYETAIQCTTGPLPSPLLPLECGVKHAALHVGTGYDYPGHWCLKGREALGMAAT